MRRSQRCTLVPAAVLTSALAVAGCGTGTALVGVHKPPAQVTTTAPVTSEKAQEIAERVLAQAAEASQATGGEAASLRKQALTGGALAVANADSRLDRPATETSSPVTKPTEPRVLAVSRGTSWPRFIIVQTTREDGAAVLNLLTSPDAQTPFRLSSSAAMHPGATVAALDTLDAGSPVLKDGKGLAARPDALLDQYAKTLAYPKPAGAKDIATNDPFSAAVRAHAAAQAKSLGKLASLTQKHTPLPRNTVAISLRDGGAVVFALMERVDTITLKAGGKSLTPSADVQRLLKKKTLTDKAELRTYETVVLTVPPSGRSRVVGVDEVLVSAKGS
jgi:hypothetical protein